MLFCCVQLEWTPHQLDFREKKLLWNASLTSGICLLSVQVRVRLQLPLFSQPAGELGRGEEAGGEGAAARSPQIRAAPQHRQGTCRHQCLHHSCSLWPSAPFNSNYYSHLIQIKASKGRENTLKA